MGHCSDLQQRTRAVATRDQQVAELVPASSSMMAAPSKTFTPLPQTSDKSNVELGERRKLCTLRLPSLALKD